MRSRRPRGYCGAEVARRPAPERRQSRRRTALLPRAALSDWPAASPEPPIPTQESVSKESGQHGHAAQKDSERHLVITIDHLRRLPCPAAGGSRIGQTAREAMGALQPDDENGRESKQRADQRSGEDRKYGELDA